MMRATEKNLDDSKEDVGTMARQYHIFDISVRLKDLNQLKAYIVCDWKVN